MEQIRQHRHDLLKNRVDSFSKTAQSLEQYTKQWLKFESSAMKAYVGMSQTLKEMSTAEPYDDLSNAFESCADAISESQAHRKQAITDRLDHTVVERVEENAAMCIKPTQMMLVERESASKSMRKAMTKFENLSERISETKLAIKKQKVQNEAMRVQHIDESIEEKVLHLEEKRIQNYKELLEDLIKSQIFYHAKSLETLSRAYKSIPDVDHVDGVNFLARELSLTPEDVQQHRRRRSSSVLSIGPEGHV